MASKGNTAANNAGSISSKNMSPFANFGPVFFQNQFRTTIELPTKQTYPDVGGRTAIITGSNTGLGYEASRQMLDLGLNHLVMGVRSIARGDAAAATLRAAYPSAKIDVWQLDMESYDSIQAFVGKCSEKLLCIDFVILNAGLAPVQFQTVATGHEKTIQVNHISTILLTVLLLPVLKNKSNGKDIPRLTIVNSVTAHLCKFPNKDRRPLLNSFDDTTITPWDAEERYGVSKLLCQLFIIRLTDKIDPNKVIVNMVDPGLTKGTSLSRDAKGMLGLAAKIFFTIAGRPVDRGAATYVDAVLGHGKEAHGCFLMNCDVAPLAHWYYEDEKGFTNAIWSETLEELKFAGVEQIIASMQS